MNPKTFIPKPLKTVAKRLLLRPELESFPRDATPEEKVIFQRVEPYTMTSIERVITLIRATKHASQLDGEFVECGVWQGGSMMDVALTLLNLGHQDRLLRLYDTFEGMTPPTEKDVRYDGVHVSTLMESCDRHAWIWADAGLDVVKKNLASTTYPATNVKYIKGRVEETIPRDIPDKISLLRLDTDWYESTKHSAFISPLGVTRHSNH